jgi:hypothetical protein
MSAVKEQETVTIIEPVSGLRIDDFKELREYRDLFFFLVWRDIKVLYAQTVLGFAWAIMNPLIQIVVFGIVFGSVAESRYRAVRAREDILPEADIPFDQCLFEARGFRYFPGHNFVHDDLLRCSSDLESAAPSLFLSFDDSGTGRYWHVAVGAGYPVS